jgi:hypothetical protein
VKITHPHDEVAIATAIDAAVAAVLAAYETVTENVDDAVGKALDRGPLAGAVGVTKRDCRSSDLLLRALSLVRQAKAIRTQRMRSEA